MTQNVENLTKAVPPGVTEEGLEKALDAFVAALGAEKVASDAETLKAYRDPYQISTWTTNLAAAVIKPTSTEEVQDRRLANEHRIRCGRLVVEKTMVRRTGSTGQRIDHCVVCNMNRVLEINEAGLWWSGVNWIDL